MYFQNHLFISTLPTFSEPNTNISYIQINPLVKNQVVLNFVQFSTVRTIITNIQINLFTLTLFPKTDQISRLFLYPFT